MTINETLLLSEHRQDRAGTTHPAAAPFSSTCLPAAGGKAEVQATAPGGIPIGVAVVEDSQARHLRHRFPVKPGDSRIDITYATPYTMGEPYAGKVPSKDENTYLIAPNGITLAGDGLNDLGAEPRTKAHIFGLAGNSYKITLTGEQIATETAAPPEEEASGPQIQQIMPRINRQVVPILGIALGILALGFALLYRNNAAPAKESNERGRR